MTFIKQKSIPVAGPWITKKEIEYVTDAITHDWYERANNYISKFENSFANYLGRRFAISLPSCTSALHLSLLAIGVGPKDEVIVPDITWIASAAPITYVGANPIFADFDPQTWCLSAKTIEACITKNTKAIIMVNLYGHMPEWDSIIELSNKYNIPIIEDAAQSIGSQYKNQLAGTFGITSCFSFHGSKTLATGEGGMLVTDNKEIFDRCMILRDHGRNPGDVTFRNIEIGYKYKISPLQAALGLAQLERIDELVCKKRQIFDWYKEAFSEMDKLTLNPDHRDVHNSYWMTTLVLDKKLSIKKDELISKLKEANIHTRPFFDPLSSLKAYSYLHAEKYREKNPIGYDISPRALNLPSALSLEKEDIFYVAKYMTDLLGF